METTKDREQADFLVIGLGEPIIFNPKADQVIKNLVYFFFGLKKFLSYPPVFSLELVDFSKN